MIRLKLLYLFTILIYISTSRYPVTVNAQKNQETAEVKAEIPFRTSINLYGWTSPDSIIQVTGDRIFAQISSDQTGYFNFQKLAISDEAKEICLTTIDSERRTGFPLCISVPESNDITEIGPVILSPTL